MAALIPGLISAIMGSGRNKNFDPKDPNSMPYEERKTGMGRFLQRWGSGVDSGEINNDYRAKRFGTEDDFTKKKLLQDEEFKGRGALQDKDFTGREKLQTQDQTFRSKLNSDQDAQQWKILQSRLSNDAALQQSGQDFQSRVLNARLSQDAQQTRSKEAQDLFEATGTWDPMQQQEILSKIREARLTEPMPLGSGSFFDRRTGRVHTRTAPSGIGFDPASGKMTPAKPAGWEEFDPTSPDRNISAPSTGASPDPATGGFKLAPEDIEALGLKPRAATQPQASPATPGFGSKIMSVIREIAGGVPTPLSKDYLSGVRSDLQAWRERQQPDIVSEYLKRRGATNQQMMGAATP